MAHPDYIAAAKLSNRTPTVFMKVESAEGETLYYTTQNDWDGSDVLTNIDTTDEPGSIIQETLDFDVVGPPVIENSFYAMYQTFTTAHEAFASESYTQLSWQYLPLGSFTNNPIAALPVGTTQTIRVQVLDDLVSPTIDFYSDAQPFNYGNGDGLISDYGLINLRTGVLIPSGTELFYRVEVLLNGSWFQMGFITNAFGITTEPKAGLTRETSQLKTSAIDFGEVTDSNPIFSTDDITESGALIAYSYEYSDAGSIYTSGGPIVDGDSLVASRFFKIIADFTTSNGGRGKVREIQVEEGLFLFFGSHPAEPFQGVSPQLVPNSISSFSQKISIGKGLSTTGQATVKMFWVPETSDLIASGYLRGQDVSIYSGFVGLNTEAYEPVIVGTWFDHSLDEVAGEITVKIQDAFKQFEKRKIPEEVIDNSDGSINTPPLVYASTSLVTVMKDVFDLIGLRDRYISPEFDALEVGQYSQAKYKVSRTLTKSTQANKLLDELAQTGAMFLIPLGNGQIKPKPFDINQEHVATLDADFIDFVNLQGNLDQFFSRFYSYYNPKTTLTSDPTDDRDDYDNGAALLDGNAELRWFPEKGTQQWFDKWKVGRAGPSTPLTVPPQALIDKNVLDNALLTEPLYTLTAKKLGPRFADIEPADVVQVNNLELPVVNNAWLNESTYTGDFKSFASETTTPVAIRLSPDESKAYVLSSGDTTLYQYTLSEPGVLSSATYDSKLRDLSGLGFPVRDFAFNPDGSTFNVLTDGGDDVYQHNMNVDFDISTVFAVLSGNTITELTNAQALWFRNDGLKMYILNQDTSSKVFQYTLAGAFQPASASYDSVFISVQAQDSAPVGLSFDIGGEFMYIVGSANDKIFSYTLSSTWVVSSASSTGSADKTAQDATPQCMLVTNNGDKMHILGGTTDSVYTYNLTSPFDITVKGYIEGDRVIHDGKMWRARQDSIGKDPTSEAAFWQDTEITSAGFTNGKHFFVLGRKFNPNDALIELDLMEMPPGTLGAFSTDEFSSAFDIG